MGERKAERIAESKSGERSGLPNRRTIRGKRLRRFWQRSLESGIGERRLGLRFKSCCLDD